MSFRSMPSRSRIVFWYSKFVSRRAVGAGFSSSALAVWLRRPASIQSTTACRSAEVGCGSSSGGISPLSSISRISSQRSRASPDDRSPWMSCRVTLPFCFFSPWHSTQFFAKKGATVSLKPDSPGAMAAKEPPVASRVAAMRWRAGEIIAGKGGEPVAIALPIRGFRRMLSGTDDVVCPKGPLST